MTITAKVSTETVGDAIALHIRLTHSDNATVDEFVCSWDEFFAFSRTIVNSADETIDSDDFNKPEKLEAFVQSIFDSQKTSSSMTHFFFLRLRQSEKLQFQRSSEVAMMGEKIARLESDNVALQRVVMDLISTVDSLKTRMHLQTNMTLEMEKHAMHESLDSVADAEDAASSKDETDIQSVQSSFFVSDSDPYLKAYALYEREMDEFVRMLQPREAQISFRQEAASIMKNLIQKALKCNAFVISFSELKCFLPDDPIKLTVVLNHAALSTWHKVLYDRLVILSEQQEIRAESNLMQLDQTDVNFKIRDVRLISEADTFKISGLMDNMPFEIVGNGRVDLSMLTFFEEVGALVGNDHLLKRSVLLIRAWWWYESLADGEKSPREYLPDCAIWLMTTALFNVYHRLIVDPVQALYLFLRIYASFDGRKEIVTLYGLKRIPDNSPVCIIERDDREYLIPPKLFEKYYNVVNVSHETNPNANAVPLSQQWKADNSSLVILNPFTMENITLEKLSNRKVDKIQAIFKQGLVNLKATFDDASGQRASLTSTVFPQTMRALLSGSARRDTAASTRHGAMSIDYIEMMKSPRDVYYVEVSQLWHEILFCNFILQGIVSESALLSLCAEVLTERRILPVGEVGKIVSDIVASPFLSSQLKEKFGGLKKFLEKYPEIFVFSKDHPFNPHVVLKRFLTPEQMEMVEAGTSLQTIFKAAQRLQQQQQQQQQQQAQAQAQVQAQAQNNSHRHSSSGSSMGIPEAVQVGKKALQSRHNNANAGHGGYGGGNGGRYDLPIGGNAPGLHFHSQQGSAHRGSVGDIGDMPFSSNTLGGSHQQSPFNLDLHWKSSGLDARPPYPPASSWNDYPPVGSGKGLQSDNVAGIPRLRGVDENFSSRYRGTVDHADRYYMSGGGGNGPINSNRPYSDQQHGYGQSHTSSSSFPLFQTVTGNPNSNNSSGSNNSNNLSFDHPAQSSGLFGGMNSGLLNGNAAPFTRGQSGSQVPGDSFFTYK